jgi:predicted amidohydrolase
MPRFAEFAEARRMPEYVVAAIQTIPVARDVSRSVEDHVRLAARAARNGARFVLFPELSLTGYDRELKPADAIPPNDPRVEPLRRIADAQGIAIIAGAPVAMPGGLCIAALCFIPNQETQIHTKRHLHDGEEIAFAPGPGGPPLPLLGRSVGIAICADITHSSHAERAASHGAHIYAASCFIGPKGYPNDARLLQGYASRHRMAVVMANYGGPCAGWDSAGASAIWSDSGALLARGPDRGEAVITASLGSNPETIAARSP